MDDAMIRRRLKELAILDLVAVQGRLKEAMQLEEVPEWGKQSLNRARLLVEGVEHYMREQADGE